MGVGVDRSVQAGAGGRGCCQVGRVRNARVARDAHRRLLESGGGRASPELPVGVELHAWEAARHKGFPMHCTMRCTVWRTEAVHRVVH